MSERNDLTPEYDEYSLAAILREYAQQAGLVEESSEADASVNPSSGAAAPDGGGTAVSGGDSIRNSRPDGYTGDGGPSPRAGSPSAETGAAGTIADRSRRIVLDALGETLRQYQAGEISYDSEPQTDAPAAAEGVVPEEDAPPLVEETTAGNGDRIVTLRPRRAEPEPADAQAIPAWVEEAARNAAAADPRPHPDYTAREEETPGFFASFKERFLTPAVRLIATRLAKRQMQDAEAANWPEPVDIRETPELTARKAGKFYTSLMGPLRIRFRIALVLCAALAWIGLGLPAFGLLGRSVQMQAGVSLILTLAVMMAALDVVSCGLRQLFDLHPGAESLAALAAILSCLDGVAVLLGHGEYAPFCAIGGVALTAALWGEVLTCRAMRRTLKTAASSKNPSVLTAEADGSADGVRSLMRSERGTSEGIVRRSETQDFCQSVYAAAAPFLLIGAVALSVLASLGGRGHFLHTLSALVSVSASFAAFFTFPLPWSIASRRLRNSGAAVAGWAGCEHIGRTRRIVITDEDLFPAGTTKFSEINVQEGVFLGKVVASTAALIEASGSGVSSLFQELVDRRGYHIPPVDEFAVHEGGGLEGIVGGERVLVGSAGFMNLMGIRLPQNLQAKNSICTAIAGELVGVFVIEYIPVTSVQDALVTLMRGRTQTVFAIRDFNITPRMISRLFRMPTDNFNFPTFRERYRVTEAGASEEAPIDAVITRGGMLPLVEAAEAGRKVYNTTRAGAFIDLIGSVIGMVIMFLLCRAGSFDTAGVGNVLSFMLLWALPVAILSFGQNRQ